MAFYPEVGPSGEDRRLAAVFAACAPGGARFWKAGIPGSDRCNKKSTVGVLSEPLLWRASWLLA